ncbi:MAG: carbohydrate-binding family 9-like protein [Candidatus Cryptobacteroides sp.]|nr:carbohydrate-binding family 9-like protein [Bacteroidales bacterium]MDY6158295.1 carbohydrate-binding family 9-like protein [Candidatus Cryptobacteroides sp.]
MQISKKPQRYPIACCNWPEFSAQCEAGVELSHSSDMLHIHYMVDEAAVVARCTADGQHVWEDSCVEFFFDPEGKGEYYNLECSCTGWIYLCKGTGRCGRIPLDDTALKSIKRRCTLPQEAFGLLGERTQWELWLDVPASVFGLESFEGLRARGNFYKCADASPFRHYLSYAPIATPKPDFHRPEFFETILFD